MTEWTPPPPAQQAYSIEDVIRIARISRTKLYSEINNGKLKVRKLGSRSLVLHDELYNWLHNLPRAEAPVTPWYTDK